MKLWMPVAKLSSIRINYFHRVADNKSINKILANRGFITRWPCWLVWKIASVFSGMICIFGRLVNFSVTQVFNTFPIPYLIKCFDFSIPVIFLIIFSIKVGFRDCLLTYSPYFNSKLFTSPKVFTCFAVRPNWLCKG